MKKIAVITPFLSGRGGTETVLKTLLSSGRVPDYTDIDLIILGGAAGIDWLNEIDERVTVQIVNSANVWKLSKLAYLILSKKYNELICLSTTIIYFSYQIRRMFRQHYRIISWIHFSLFDEKTVDTRRIALADWHLAISSGIAEQLQKLGVSKSKISMVYNPVDKKDRYIKPSDGKSLKLAYVGRVIFQGQKNIKEFLDALLLWQDTKVEVHFFGTGEVSICEAYAKKIGVKQRLVWHGWVDDPWRETEVLDYTVLTSKYEGFPMVLLESISYGVPVISANCPTGPDDIVSADNGYLYQAGSTNSLMNCLKDAGSRRFDHLKVKASIKQFYTDNYIANFWEKLQRMSVK